jgi:multiple sugar transport system permease protein
MATSTATMGPSAGLNTSSMRPFLRGTRVVLTYGLLILFALAMIMPFIYAVSNSFKTLPDINQNPQSLLADPAIGWTLAGYNKVLTTDQVNFPRALFNSIVIAVVVTVGRVIFSSMAGYALARIKFPGRAIAFAALVGTLMIPGIVLLIPRFLILKQLSMIDTYWGLIFPALADAFGIFLMKQFFESIPGEVEEAAEIDGASRIRMFFTIILPMAVPALTALAIFSFQGSWNDFTGPLIAVSGNKDLYTLPLALAFLRGVTGSALQWDILLPSAVITTVPMALIFFFFQRFFIEGTSYTAVKG